MAGGVLGVVAPEGLLPQANLMVVTVAVASVLLVLMLSRQLFGQSLNTPPGSLSVMHTVKLFRNPEHMFKTMYDFQGAVRKVRFLHRPTIIVRDYEAVKTVLGGEGDIVRSDWPPSIRTLLGEESILFTTGSYHRSLRRMLGPCFTAKVIEGYLPQIQAITRRYCAQWEAMSTDPSAKLPVMHNELRALTFDVLTRTVLGWEVDDAEMRRLSDAFHTLTMGLFVLLPFKAFNKRYRRALEARQEILKAVDVQLDAFEQRNKNNKNAKQHTTTANSTAANGTTNGAVSGSVKADAEGDVILGSSVMERLLGMTDEEGKPLSRKALQDMGVVLLFAGHETTASSLLRSLGVLVQQPEFMVKLRAEQEAVVAQHGADITAQAIAAMPYLDAFVKEVWRLYPIVNAVPREALKDFKLAGYDVPKGWHMSVGLKVVTHEHPLWAKYAQQEEGEGQQRHPLHPLEFNPDRWLAPGVDSPIGILTGHMMTFGAGGRYCLGAQLAWAEFKVVVAELVRRYDISTPLEHFEFKTFPSLSVTEGLPMKITPRAGAAAFTAA